MKYRQQIKTIVIVFFLIAAATFIVYARDYGSYYFRQNLKPVFLFSLSLDYCFSSLLPSRRNLSHMAKIHSVVFSAFSVYYTFPR